MPTDSSFGTFFLPGPTEVRAEVLAAMLKPMIPHRSSEFEELFGRLQDGLRSLFMTKRPVFVSASSGTGMMEAAIRALPPGPVLCLVNGAFSERFAHIAEMCGRQVDRYEVPWGEVHDLTELDNYLSNKRYRAITATHSETSTGALNQVRAISDAAHARGALCMIDSVSGLGGAELRFDEWKLDYVLTGSQKAIALPPGLAFAVASEEMIKLAEKAENRGVYFDLVEMNKFARTKSGSGDARFLPPLRTRGSARSNAARRRSKNGGRGISTCCAATECMAIDRQRTHRGNLENIVKTESRSPDRVHDSSAGSDQRQDFRPESKRPRDPAWRRLRQAWRHDFPHWTHGRSHRRNAAAMLRCV